MEKILSKYSVSISELKKNPTAVLQSANGESVAILNHNKPTAYLIPAELYGMMMEVAEEYELMNLVKERENEKASAIKVSLDELIGYRKMVERMIKSSKDQ
jgi:antitoxin StbD